MPDFGRLGKTAGAAATVSCSADDGFGGRCQAAGAGCWFRRTLDKNPAGMALAGRVVKGADEGSIACHAGTDGEDYLFVTNRIN